MNPAAAGKSATIDLTIQIKPGFENFEMLTDGTLFKDFGPRNSPWESMNQRSGFQMPDAMRT
jgi:hypothetical protein